ncbi:hypothetical protein PAPYR_6523 [Paratrimastix pyriformis]|uniref:Uncharacterized protein n=1 Tax=Paratrimastix pyriformis TaxID=342808 RepID=A0ABQ8UJG2_9EUKA|nr:hypothetical protein PAPYR_6523 [Paratrimastix pyriformis]
MSNLPRVGLSPQQGGYIRDRIKHEEMICTKTQRKIQAQFQSRMYWAQSTDTTPDKSPTFAYRESGGDSPQPSTWVPCATSSNQALFDSSTAATICVTTWLLAPLTPGTNLHPGQCGPDDDTPITMPQRLATSREAPELSPSTRFLIWLTLPRLRAPLAAPPE